VPKTQRLAAAGALVVVVVLSQTACGGREKHASAGPVGITTVTSTKVETEWVAPSSSAGESATTSNDVFGPVCRQFPQDPQDKGSLQSMAAEPVGTAIGNNPLLTTLAAQVGKAGLADLLNAVPEMTIFAPADPAFAGLGAKAAEMAADPELLRRVISYHVVPKRYDREGLIKAKEVQTLEGGTIKINSRGDNLMANDGLILCGNIPTRNATVFVIGEVLQPPTG
jgi:uncharacterized surface protein with fasciclin (FAS1) repeats